MTRICRLYTLLAIGALSLLPIPALARQRGSGWCSTGGVPIKLTSLPAYAFTPKVQGSYVGCNVTVYFSGTTTKATIYSDNNGTALDNPFQADTTVGSWQFYADNGRYDVQISGADIPNSFTFGDILLSDLTGPNGASLINYTAAGGFTETIAVKLGQIPSITDYGNVGAGQDAASALTTAIAHATYLYIPPGTYPFLSNVTIPATTGLWIAEGATLAPATGTTLTMGPFQAGDYQVFGGAGTVKITSGASVNPLWWAGDIGVEINSAIAALQPRGSSLTSGGTINIPAGDFSTATGINGNNTRNITLNGAGGINAGASAATIINYTAATGNIISANQTSTFIVKNIQFVANNPSWAGEFVDYSHGALTFDSAFGVIDQCGFFGINGAFASVGIDLDKAIVTTVQNSNINNAVVGVRGSAVTGSYSNANIIRHNHFSSSTGTIKTAQVQNPGQAWEISNNAFEMGTAAGTPDAISCASGFSGSTSVHITSNWIGDWTNGASGANDIVVCGGGYTILANEIASPGSGSITAVKINNSVAGTLVSGNKFDTAAGTVLFALGSSVRDLDILANIYASSPVFMTGTPLTGVVTDNLGATTLYGNVTIAGNLTATVANLVGQMNATTNAGLPSAIGASGAFITGGFGSPTIARTYIGDGSGYQYEFAKRVGGTDTVVGFMSDRGYIDMTVGYRSGGLAGLTVVKNVTGSGGAACTLTFTGGLLTASTCP